MLKRLLVWLIDRVLLFLLYAWTTPENYTAGQLIDETAMDKISANLSALKAPPNDQFEDFSYSQSLSVGSTFANVEATDLSLSITTTGGDVDIAVSGWFSTSSVASGQFLWFDVTLDGVRMGDTTEGMFKWEIADTDAQPFSFFYRKTSLASGAHTFNLQAKENSAVTITLLGIFFAVREAT